MEGIYGQSCVEGHTALIYDRGGARRLHQLIDLSAVEWGRVLSGKSKAQVTVSGRACAEQAATLNAIQAHRHELVIFRGAERVWEGPILQVEWHQDRAVILANDVSDYLDGTPLSIDWPNEEGGGPRLMTDRVDAIIRHELADGYTMETNGGPVFVPGWEGIDPPVNLLPFLDVRPSGSLLTRSATLSFEMLLGEHLYNLSQSGLDWTAVGRSLIYWDSAQALARTRALTEADFYGEVSVIASGADQASIAHLSGQRPESDPDDPTPPASTGVGHAGAAHSYYGVWTRIISQANEEGSDEPTQEELNSQAQRGLLGRTPVPLEVVVDGSGGIRLSQGLGINDLVAGAEVPVTALLNLRPVSQLQRIKDVTVDESADGETIKVTLIPAGAVESVGP